MHNKTEKNINTEIIPIMPYILKNGKKNKKCPADSCFIIDFRKAKYIYLQEVELKTNTRRDFLVEEILKKYSGLSGKGQGK